MCDNVKGAGKKRVRYSVSHVMCTLHILCSFHSVSIRNIGPRQTFKAQWLFYVPPGPTFKNLHCAYRVHFLHLNGSQEKQLVCAYRALVFKPMMECVHCAVQTESLTIVHVSL
jgi:hypothetical protein